MIFINSQTDNTFYNIAISYIAAYIFYLIQIYIPTIENNKHSISILRKYIEKNVNSINLLLLLISELTDNCNGELYPNNTMELYILEKEQSQILKITFSKTYHDLKSSIQSINELILSNHAFSNLDNNIIELFSSLPIDDLFAISDNLFNQKSNIKKTNIKLNGAIDKIQFIISQLSQRYGFVFENYTSVTDDELKREYDIYSQHAWKYTYKELEVKVQLTNVPSIS